MKTSTISVASFGTAQFIPHVGSFVAALFGQLEGAVWAKETSEHIRNNNGTESFGMVHEFVCTDGSTLSTVDSVIATPVPQTDEVHLAVEHRVVNATGRFESASGTFPSFGVHNLKTGHGVQRFLGTLTLTM